MWQELGYDEAIYHRTCFNIFCLEAIAKLQTFCYINIKNELNFYDEELLECDLRDNINGLTINSSQLEFEQSDELFNSFKPISGSYNNNMQSNDMDNTNLLIKEIIDLTNPAF
ncbi:4322_t:CDS:2, partial [Racocetra fulgida]